MVKFVKFVKLVHIVKVVRMTKMIKMFITVTLHSQDLDQDSPNVEDEQAFNKVKTFSTIKF